MNGIDRSGTAGSNFSQTVELFVLVATVISSAALTGWVVFRAGYGYDFSDEGMYLNWIADPWISAVSVTQFSYIYHPLYRLVGGDIVLLRQANIFITLCIGWALCFVLLRKLTDGAGALPWWRSPYVGVGTVLSTNTLASLHFFWLPTPNYDSLALQSLLIAATGMLLAETEASNKSLLGWLLIGIAGWLAFMAKPTTALALGVAIGLYLLLTDRLMLRMLMISLLTAVCLGLVSAWSIDGTIARFALRLALGANDARLLQGLHTLGDALRWDDFHLNRNEIGTLTIATLLVFLATCLCLSRQQTSRACGAVCALVPTLVCLCVILLGGSFQLGLGRFQGLQYWAVLLGALLTVVAMAVWGNHSRRVTRDHWALVICFAAFPHIFAFGTNENYWTSGSRAAIFWVLAGVVLLAALQRDKITWRIFLPAAAGAQFCTTILLFVSMEHPYRQTQPLRLNKDFMHFAGTGSKLLVSRGFADYVAKLQLQATTAGFNVGDRMLDLTGHYPGALYVLGAKSVGSSWMIGGYPGSEDLAIANLDRVSPGELKSAWILTEPDGPRKLSPDILKRYGIDLSKDYTEVGKLDSPTGYYPDSYQQHLFKPTR